MVCGMMVMQGAGVGVASRDEQTHYISRWVLG